MADTKAGGVFVEIGGRNEKLRAAYREAEAVTRSSLGAMGRQAAAFSTRFASALGIGVAGGAAGLFGATIKASVEFRAALVELGTQAATSGRDFKELLKIVDAVADSMGKLTGTRRSQVAQITSETIRAGIPPEQVQKVVAGIAAFAALRSLDPVSVAQTFARTQITGGGFPQGFGIRLPTNVLPQQARDAFLRRIAKDLERVPATGIPGGFFKRLGAGTELLLTALGEFGEEAFKAAVKQLDKMAAKPGGPFLRISPEVEARLQRAPISEEQRDFLRRRIQTGGRPPMGMKLLEFIGSTVDDLIAGGGAPERALRPLLEGNVAKALRDVVDPASQQDVIQLFEQTEEQMTDLTGVSPEGRRRAGFTGQGPTIAIEDQMPVVRELKIMNEKLEEIKTTIDEGGRVF